MELKTLSNYNLNLHGAKLAFFFNVVGQIVSILVKSVGLSLGGSMREKGMRQDNCSCFCCVADAGNQLVAQEALRKPSILRRPSARTGEPQSSTYSNHLSLSASASKTCRHECADNSPFLFFLADCLNCSRISDLSDRLNSLEAKVPSSLPQPPRLDLTVNSSSVFSRLFSVRLCQVQSLAAPASTPHRHLQGNGGSLPEALSLMGAKPAQGSPGEQGPPCESTTLLD